MSRIAHKSFVEKEEKLRKSVVQLVEDELITDLSSLCEEGSFADINFQVGNENVPGHSAILRLRAPKFYQKIVNPILCSLSSPPKTPIHLQGLEAEEFKTFLRSVYTEGNVKVIDEVTVENLVLEDHGVGSNENSQNGVADNISEKEKKRQGKLSTLKACCKVGDDLLFLVDDESTTDVTFVLEGGEMVKAHRAILQTRSSYFAAMFCGGWSEYECRNIHLKGVPYCAFKTVLYYLYGGITNIQVDLASVYDVLSLADMYGLQGLKEVVIACIKIERCHLFHKPCKACVGTTCECLEVSEIFHLTALKEECIRWIAKYFERVCCKKEFASISKKLQDEVLEQLRTGIALNTVVSFLERCDRLSYNTPTVKWAESVHLFVHELESGCLKFAAQHLARISRDRRFIDMIKGVGWFVSIVEKIFEAVIDGLTVENCCVQLKVANQLCCENFNEEENYPEEIKKLLDKLHHKCSEFIRSNLNRVVVTDGWKFLHEVTRNSLTTDAVIVDMTDGKNHSTISARRLPQTKKLTANPKTPRSCPKTSRTPQLQGCVQKLSQRSVSAKNKSEASALRLQGSKTGVTKVSNSDVKSAWSENSSLLKSKSRSLANSKDSSALASRNMKTASSQRFKQLSQKGAAPITNDKSQRKIRRENSSEILECNTTKPSVIISKTGNVSKVTGDSAIMSAVNNSFPVKDPNLLRANNSITVHAQSWESAVSKEESSELNSSERKSTGSETQERFNHNKRLNSDDTEYSEIAGASAALSFGDRIYFKTSSMDISDVNIEENRRFNNRSAKTNPRFMSVTQTSNHEISTNHDGNFHSENPRSSSSFHFSEEMQESSSLDFVATLPPCVSLSPATGKATSNKIVSGKNHISCSETTTEIKDACGSTLGLITDVFDGSTTEDTSPLKIISRCDKCECEGGSFTENNDEENTNNIVKRDRLKVVVDSSAHSDENCDLKTDSVDVFTVSPSR